MGIRLDLPLDRQLRYTCGSTGTPVNLNIVYESESNQSLKMAELRELGTLVVVVGKAVCHSFFLVVICESDRGGQGADG